MVYGGASLGTLHLAERVDPERFHSTIICGHQSENEGELFNIMQKRRVNVIVIPAMVREIYPLKDFVTLMKLIAIIKKYRYDIVHVHGSKAGTIGRLAAAIARVPVILYTVHGWGLKAGTIVTRVLFRCIERVVSHFTTRILFQTHSDINEARVYEIGREEQYVFIGNGIDLERFINYRRKHSLAVRRELGLAGQKVVGTVGRVSGQKNPVGFVDIAQYVLKKRDDVVFIFVGGGELLHEMRALVKQMNCDDRILFIGPRDDVAEILALFDVFILPSLWEGMPRSVIEAMALSKPVVVNRIGGIDELIQDGEHGLIVSEDDPQIFVEKICFLLENPNIRQKMGGHGYVRSRDFDFGNVIKKTATLYAQLIRKSV